VAVRQRHHAEPRCSGWRAPGDRPPPAPTHELAGDEAIGFGRREVRAPAHARHTPGSLCLYFEETGGTPLLFAGDTLFKGVGRAHGPVGGLPPGHNRAPFAIAC
jgi:glyoxylase-like metal-dependent hydrolase (beta-lactamase superfamily II)